jgi:mannosyltransferase OCH1-like enzyme
MSKILHQVWIQGESELPQEYVKSRSKWREDLPDDWEMMLWDNDMAREKWHDYKEVEASCSSHAMRGDLILARALRDYGGLACGADVIPNNIPDLLNFVSSTDTMIVTNPKGKACSNGITWFRDVEHEFCSCVCRYQLLYRDKLPTGNVWHLTGPGAWWGALAVGQWNLTMVTDRKAFTHLCRDIGKEASNPEGWVNPVYAGSWH